jgi:hypothetical protein
MTVNDGLSFNRHVSKVLITNYLYSYITKYDGWTVKKGFSEK